jgi:hypothetical protein
VGPAADREAGVQVPLLPTPEQAEERARTFGCVCLVYNKSLEERTRAYTVDGRKVDYVQPSATLTEWKRSQELAFLNEAGADEPCVPGFGSFAIIGGSGNGSAQERRGRCHLHRGRCDDRGG